MADEVLQAFIDESNEHLASIEASLLTIEERGADVDEKLVNEVFRAAHSIKGGSGFFGLNRIKELAHKAETVLDLIRSRQMVPNAEVVGLLLAAFDRLRGMINDCAGSEQVEIGDLVEGLTGLAASYLGKDRKAALRQSVQLTPQGEGGRPVAVPEVDLERTRRQAQFLYAVDYDLIHDIERKGRTVLDLFRGLEEQGEILDCTVDFEAVGALDGTIGNVLPLRLVYATALKPSAAIALLGLPRERVRRLLDGARPQVDEPSPSPEAAPEPEAAAPAPPSAAPEPAPLPAPPAAPPEVRPAGETTGATEAARAAGEGTLRVSVGLLDTLMNLAGELVLSRNQLRAAISLRDQQSLSDAEQRLDQVTASLQDVIMQTRLQPIGNVFGKFPRVVRDLSRALGKDVRLEVDGREVALDRSVIEGLSDPLTHMIRNAVDHGIEAPEVRARAGKRAQGVIRLTARHEAGQVVVEVGDDGGGIDTKRVAESALRKGLVGEERLRAMSEQDRAALIFLPGLSTAAAVTDVSGRGVGMDVVKTNLDRLGGKVDIRSELGRGTTFRIKLPLTLAIIPSLIVSIEGERFAIPQVNIEELLRIQPEDRKRRIGKVGGAEVLLLRDRILPLVDFAEVLGALKTYVDPHTGRRELDRRARLADRRSPRLDATVAPPPAAPAPRQDADRRQRAASALEIAVVTTGSLSYGLVVDAFHDSEEIVVKPLGRHLKALSEYAGATILGDGRVALIVDAAGLAAKAELLARAAAAARDAEASAEDAEPQRGRDAQALLLFQNAPDELCALPLDLVERVERVAPEQLESAGGRRTIQYRGASLPLVTLADTARVKPLGEGRDLAVIVSRVRGREIGLLGAMPVDVVETDVAVDAVSHRQPGISGSAIIRDRTVLLTDLFELVDAVYPEWGREEAARAPAAGDAPRAGVLLAEDSDFFRAQVQRFLEQDGHAVLAAPDGEEAWELLLAHLDEIQVVVTDVEMPRLGGLGLATRIKADPRTAALPIIALSSLAGEEDVARGLAAGVGEYLVKLDRDRLLAAVRARLAAPTDAPRESAAPDSNHT